MYNPKIALGLTLVAIGIYNPLSDAHMQDIENVHITDYDTVTVLVGDTLPAKPGTTSRYTLERIDASGDLITLRQTDGKASHTFTLDLGDGDKLPLPNLKHDFHIARTEGDTLKIYAPTTSLSFGEQNDD